MTAVQILLPNFLLKITFSGSILQGELSTYPGVNLFQNAPIGCPGDKLVHFVTNGPGLARYCFFVKGLPDCTAGRKGLIWV